MFAFNHFNFNVLDLERSLKFYDEALGLRPAQVYRWIILPQAVRRLIPQSINLMTRMIKTTSLVTLIGVV